MEDFEKIAGESRTSALNAKRETFVPPVPGARGVAAGEKSPASGGASLVSGNGEPLKGEDESIWKELSARREKASRRIGEGWERVSENAKTYADDHSVGVALGMLGVGLALGILIGAIAARD